MIGPVFAQHMATHAKAAALVLAGSDLEYVVLWTRFLAYAQLLVIAFADVALIVN